MRMWNAFIISRQVQMDRGGGDYDYGNEPSGYKHYDEFLA
jgi:hypothetical protein